jgi:hypothetical protein
VKLSSVARPHRLAFAFRDDDGLNLDAEHLALVCPGERPLRLVGRGPSEQRGVPGPGAVLTASASSASCARPVCLSSTRSRAGSRFGECVSPGHPPAPFAEARAQQEGARLGGGDAKRLLLLQRSGSSSASAADDDEPLITDGSAAPSRPTSWAPAPPQVASICAGRCVASSVFETEEQVAQRG